MTEEEAGWTSYREFELRLKGYREAERSKWEVARWQMFLAMQMHPNIKKGQKPSNPQAWIPFPWEKQQNEPQGATIEPLTQIEITALAEIFNIDREKFSNG